ncbi:MAG TPA: group 1 truncated hemoglobin [Candidatus Binatia bacterium]
MTHRVISKMILAIFCITLSGSFVGLSSEQGQMSDAGPSLYKRLGGYDAIAAVTDDFLGRLAADKQMSRFFVGVSADSLRKLRQHVVDQLCEATGGPCYYFGRSMKTVHAGLGITDSDWQLTVKHLNATLDEFKIVANERTEIVTMFAGIKKDIVEKP